MSIAGISTWLKWFSDEYEDNAGLYPYSDNSNHDLIEMAFARNKILAGGVDALERIATILEKEFERHNSV